METNVQRLLAELTSQLALPPLTLLFWHTPSYSPKLNPAEYIIHAVRQQSLYNHLLGFEFAPRIKGLSKQKLYAFKPRKHYEEQEFILLPTRRIREDIIEHHWDDILRFIATIQLKIRSASQLFRRLNSYSKQHSLYQALKEFGKILKSLFILKYYDDCPFRQSIEGQLNKVENSNKFSKAISFGHNDEFIQSEKEDQVVLRVANG